MRMLKNFYKIGIAERAMWLGENYVNKITLRKN